MGISPSRRTFLTTDWVRDLPFTPRLPPEPPGLWYKSVFPTGLRALKDKGLGSLHYCVPGVWQSQAHSKCLYQLPGLPYKVTQAGRGQAPKTAEIYSPTVWRYEVRNRGAGRALPALKPLREGPSLLLALAALGFPGLRAAPLQSVPCRHWACLCLCLCLFSSSKKTGEIGFKAHPAPV